MYSPPTPMACHILPWLSWKFPRNGQLRAPLRGVGGWVGGGGGGDRLRLVCGHINGKGMGALVVCAQELDLQAMGTRHWRILGCSAKTGAGLLEGFDWLVNDIRSRIFLLD